MKCGCEGRKVDHRMNIYVVLVNVDWGIEQVDSVWSEERHALQRSESLDWTAAGIYEVEVDAPAHAIPAVREVRS